MADSQGRRGYTVEEVKAMAIAKGLPVEIKKIGGYKSRGKRVGMEIITPRSTVEALGLEREWSLYYPHEYPKAKADSQAVVVSHVDPYEYASHLASLNID